MANKEKLSDGKVKVDLSVTKVADALSQCRPKEQLVLLKKFGLDGGKEVPLQRIGAQYGLTRERVRQIEAQGLLKFRKAIVGNKRYMSVIEDAKKILQSQGGFLLEEDLISRLINKNQYGFKAQEIKLIVVSDFDIYYLKRNKYLKKSFYIEPLYESLIEEIARYILDYFKNRGKAEDLYEFINKLSKQFEPLSAKIYFLTKKSFYLNLFKGIRGIAVFDGKIGLDTFEEVNPKTIKQKLVYVLRRIGKPVHYEELTNKVMEWFPEKRVKVNTVHNELVKNNDLFVNMGVGLYGLREWGIEGGTVKDIIKRILKNSDRPLTVKEITKEVMREKLVSANTISMVLQRNQDIFKRVSKGVYGLKGKHV